LNWQETDRKARVKVVEARIDELASDQVEVAQCLDVVVGLNFENQK
jgi:hypothetical protein